MLGAIGKYEFLFSKERSEKTYLSVAMSKSSEMACRIPCPAIGKLDSLSNEKGGNTYGTIDGGVGHCKLIYIGICLVDLPDQKCISVRNVGHSSSQGQMTKGKRAEE